MRNKYNARKTERDGFIFDSIWEADRYSELKLLERAGLIRDLVVKPKPAFVLQPAYTRSDGKRIRAITYQPDFTYYDCDLCYTVIEDAKGFETPVFKLKRKMFEYRIGQIIRVTKRGKQ